MNVTLTPALERFLADRMSTGHYADEAEVVREAMRLLHAHYAGRLARPLALDGDSPVQARPAPATVVQVTKPTVVQAAPQATEIDAAPAVAHAAQAAVSASAARADRTKTPRPIAGSMMSVPPTGPTVAPTPTPASVQVQAAAPAPRRIQAAPTSLSMDPAAIASQIAAAATDRAHAEAERDRSRGQAVAAAATPPRQAPAQRAPLVDTGRETRAPEDVTNSVDISELVRGISAQVHSVDNDGTRPQGSR